MSFDWKDLEAGGSPPTLSEAGKEPAPLERVPERGTEWRLDRVDRVLLIVILLYMGISIGSLLISPLLPPLPTYLDESCLAYSDVPLMVPLCVAWTKVVLII